jgi:hypothetical protein
MTKEPPEPAAFGGQMARYFRLPKAPSIVIAPPSKQQIAITHLASQSGLPDQTASIPRERAFVVSVHLTPACDKGCEIWVDGRYKRLQSWPSGGVGVYDLEANPRVRNRGPVDWVHYHVPRPTLDLFTDDVHVPTIRNLHCQPGTVDPVLHQMTLMMLPTLTAPHQFCELFLDYFRLLLELRTSVRAEASACAFSTAKPPYRMP